MKIELVSGCEGYSLCANDYRIAGPKPWGGGKIVKTWIIKDSNLRRLLSECTKELEAAANEQR